MQSPRTAGLLSFLMSEVCYYFIMNADVGKSDAAKREEEILVFWNERRIFEKSLEKPAPNGEFVFYDGPPFATGLPHYGHILAGTIKDAIPRYKTMRGYRVPRRWGWDCHGLPLENEIEKELDLKTKRDIEVYGVGAFNAKARGNVLRYADDWKRIVPRMGRWVDMEDDYKTMDAPYTESVWWSFKTLYDKKLIYEGFKSMHLCPRCETTLSNFEVSQGYKDIADLSVIVKLELADEPGVFLLAWTTTPWTLPGNMAAAVSENAVYARVVVGGERFILAKDLVSKFFTGASVEGEVPGRDLVGKKYKPPFPYYADANVKGKENAWKVYAADFVTFTEGTGVVHVAPAFGAEDLKLAQEEGIPVVHHVATDGTFKPEVADFAGLPVKPKDDHQSADVAIIKNLAHRNLLFKKEKVTHSYPHCWRCDTPLINYASHSWFVRVTALKDKLLRENRKTRWVPADIRDGRFGKWLEGARDWAISRSRYWGAPIPVWKDAATGEVTVMGSVADMRAHTKRSGNRYYAMRHGEADHNVADILSSNPENTHHLTEKGRKQVEETARSLKGKSIDFVIASPFARTRETADIIMRALGLAPDKIIVDERIVELKVGAVFEGKSVDSYHAFFSDIRERFTRAPEGGETIPDVRKRMGAFLYSLEEKFSNKNILIISHGDPLWSLRSVASGLNREEMFALRERDYPEPGCVYELDFVPLPHNSDYELDLHRPFIDGVELVSGKGNPLVRVPDVFDCWFESGSMPYAQSHYPFENVRFKPNGWFGASRGFPADFIAEGLDQTRGWFYSLLVLGVALFGKSPYRNVIVNGLVLAEDGRKVSKRFKNYPEPMDIVGRYGADALRLYLLSSPLMRGEDLNFSEQNVGETMRKNISRLDNVLAFYNLYPGNETASRESTHVLDRWILARLDELILSVTSGLEVYELDTATRPISDFIDDLSTWYLRRSRDRFKSNDAAAARATTRYVLRELAKVMAPMTPFFAEHLFRAVCADGGPESVHLADWPEAKKVDRSVLDAMSAARRIVAVGLEARAKAGVKVRQPLASMETIEIVPPEYVPLIVDELNVKEVLLGASADGLDTALTPDLVEEGVVRELVRHVQDMRKRAGLSPKDHMTLVIGADPLGEMLVEKHGARLAEVVLASSIVRSQLSGEPVRIGDYAFSFSIRP